MSQKRRKQYSAEFKAEAVRLVQQGDRAPAVVARELGVPKSCVTTWVRQAEVDQGLGAPGELTTTEREELTRLRKEVQRLQMEKEILKKATAFFAKENT